jgi:hypothetical protein
MHMPLEPKSAKPDCRPVETVCDSFNILQLGESIKLISDLHRILHTVIPVMVTADVACIVASLQYRSYSVVALGAVFPFLIYFYVKRVRKMSLAPFLTGISIEQAYGRKDISYLLSFYMSFVYNNGDYERIVEISRMPGNAERLEAMKDIKFNRNFGKLTLYMYWVPGFGFFQIVAGLAADFHFYPEHLNYLLSSLPWLH